jgi:hypothetical protein
MNAGMVLAYLSAGAVVATALRERLAMRKRPAVLT